MNLNDFLKFKNFENSGGSASGGSGGGSGGEFVINVASTDSSGGTNGMIFNNITSDKTYAEVRAAYDAGQQLVVKFHGDGSYYRLNLSVTNSTGTTFIFSTIGATYNEMAMAFSTNSYVVVLYFDSATIAARTIKLAVVS